MSIYNYSNFSISQLIEKIGKARYFDLPSMLKEVLTKINTNSAIDSRPYKVYTAILSTSGTNAPIAEVLENTTGKNIEYTRDSEGYYNITASELFLPNKTYIQITNTDLQSYEIEINNSSEVYLGVYTTDTLEPQDLSFDIFIEIRVYN